MKTETGSAIVMMMMTGAVNTAGRGMATETDDDSASYVLIDLQSLELITSQHLHLVMLD